MIATAGWKRAVLPTEHGVWGLLAGTALIGLPLGHDLAGLGLLLACLAVVIARQAASARAWGILLALTVVVAAAAAATWIQAHDRLWWPWALAAAVAGAVQEVVPARSWWRSACAGIAFALLAAAVATAGGAPRSWVVVAAAFLAGHFVAMVPLVRAQTRSDPRWRVWAVESHVLLALTAVAGWVSGLIPAGVPLLATLGLARCCLLVDKHGMMSKRRAAMIGLCEMAWLPVVALGVVLSVRCGMP